MDDNIINSSQPRKKEINNMALIINIAMVLIGIFALLMFNYLDEKN
jgi:hypothetical protein